MNVKKKGMGGFRSTCLVLLILSWAAVSHGAPAGRLYRYINGEGVVVIDDKIPPNYVAQGYDILSKTGQLLDTVAPSVPQNPVEKALRKKALAAREKEERFILISYSSIGEIQAAMARKLDQLDREVKGIKTNIEGSTKRIALEQQRAANYQRGGRQVPENVKETLFELEAEVIKSESLLELKQEEYEKTEERYLGYIDRYRQLKAQSETNKPE
jgi:Mg2+ and Co2+ transporter CorA